MSVADGLQILAGIGFLIYGIVMMGETLQAIAGDRLRKLISSLAGTPVKGLFAGVAVTAILQSSSATTIMVVSFVDSGLMTLTQAIGVILGANVGTTLTAQLIAFDITDFAYVCAVVGAALTLVGPKKRHRQFGRGLIGFGLLFVGMDMMSEPLAFLKTRPEIMTIFGGNVFYAFLAGLAVTTVVQSSTATVGLTMVVAAQGLVPLESAIAMILGDNIGTTFDALLASMGGKRAAKQAAAAHVMFNVIGAVIMMLLLPYYTTLITHTASDIPRQVANAHSIFNIINACLFLPFVRPYAALIRKIVPDAAGEADVPVNYLNPVLIGASPAAAVDAVRKAMIQLASFSLKMIETNKVMFDTKNDKLVGEIDHMERNVNEMTHETVRYATKVAQTGLPSDLSLVLNTCISGIGDMERVGDHATNLSEMYQFMQDHDLSFSAEALEELDEMFDLVTATLVKSIHALETEDPELAQEVLDLEDRIDYMEKSLRMRHIGRLNDGECVPSAGVVFIDILSNLERVGDHAHNIVMLVFDIERIHNRAAVQKS